MRILVDGDSLFANTPLIACIDLINVASKKAANITVLFIREVELYSQLKEAVNLDNVKMQRVWSIGLFNEQLDLLILESHIKNLSVDFILSKKSSLNLHNITTFEGLDELLAFSELDNKPKAQAEKEYGETKLKLAFLTPLPPQRSGIADYSAMLLPELTKFYDIEVFSELANDYECKSYKMFEEEAKRFDRVIYQLGNNPMHSDIYEIMTKYPGVSVLHDFNLGDLLYFRQSYEGKVNAFTAAIIGQHGYKSLVEKDLNKLFTKNPCSGDVFTHSVGVITHSHHAVDKAKNYYSSLSNTARVPLIRKQPAYLGKCFKAYLGISENKTLVSSFGMIGEAKMHLDIIDAWVNSGYGKENDHILCFVGGLPDNEYGAKLKQKISSIGESCNIIVTGFVDDVIYEKYLASTDVAIQLRRESRGETSAAILDCLNYGIPTITNQSDAFDHSGSESVYSLAADFNVIDIGTALHKLLSDKYLRSKLGAFAKKLINENHRPANCAQAYFETIERLYKDTKVTTNTLLKKIKSRGFNKTLSNHKLELAKAIVLNEYAYSNEKSLFIDITSVHQTDIRTGIQRVVRALSREMLLDTNSGLKVKLVYLSDKAGYWDYYEASIYTKNLLDIEHDVMPDLPVVFGANDVLLHLDFTADGLADVFFNTQHLYPMLEQIGTKVLYVVYDLLPVRMPEYFPEGTSYHHHRWLEFVSKSDGVMCISEAVRNDFLTWVEEYDLPLKSSFIARSFPLGCDLINSNPSKGFPDDSEEVLRKIRENLTFLMVGTIEPRKGHTQVLQAFIELWKEGVNFNLVFVGKKGWLGEEGLALLNNAVESYPGFVWLNGISDEYLEKIYDASSCLLAASEGEGYGLPLIEAASHKLPIIARDLPVFREVAQNCAYFFANEGSTHVIKDAVLTWEQLFENSSHPSSANIKLSTWKDCKDSLLEKLMATNVN
jgi:glycosyltransferase involved in cell wall biosynthesis